MGEMIRTYEPDNSLRKGYPWLLREILEEVVKNRWLTYQLFRRDLLSIYKQSLIGLFWVLVLPIFSVSIFVALRFAGVLRVGDLDAPYPIFAVLGMAFWQLFSTGLVACSQSLVDAGPMIVKINVSKKSIVIASMGKSIVVFLVQILLLCILFLGYGVTPSWAILLVPILVLPLMLLTAGLGFIFSLLNGIMRDIASMLSIFLTFFMFLTPVLYTKPRAGFLAAVTAYNPLYYLVSVPRELILEGSTLEWRGFLWASCSCLVVFAFCLVAFHLTETRVTERI